MNRVNERVSVDSENGLPMINREKKSSKTVDIEMEGDDEECSEVKIKVRTYPSENRCQDPITFLVSNDI